MRQIRSFDWIICNISCGPLHCNYRRYSHSFPSSTAASRPPIHTPPSGTSIGGFTIVYRSAQVMRVGAYCVIGPGAVGTGP